MHKVICLIPARGNSTRMPQKNLAKLDGRTLVEWAIECAKCSRLITHIYVTTDCPVIARLAERAGVAVLDEPEHLAQIEDLDAVVNWSWDEIRKTHGQKWDAGVHLFCDWPLRTSDAVDLAILTAWDTGRTVNSCLVRKNGPNFEISPTGEWQAFPRKKSSESPLFVDFSFGSHQIEVNTGDDLVAARYASKLGISFNSNMIGYLPTERAYREAEKIEIKRTEFSIPIDAYKITGEPA